MARPPNSVDFFRVWSPAMAYVLGYWYADGYMYIKPNTGAHQVEFASIDRGHLEAIARLIGGKTYLRKVVADANCYELTYCSKEMYHDLLAHGGTPHKSRIIRLPSIPAELLPHFVRGFADGDGTLSWNEGKPIFQIYSASQDFLLDLGSAIEQATGIPAPNIIANRLLWTIKWSTIRAKCLAAWLYIDNPGLAMGDKLAVAARFLEWCPKKTPQRGTITDEMRLRFSEYLPL